jgi:hypothetical protein
MLPTSSTPNPPIRVVGKNAQEPLSHRALGHKMPPKKVQQIQEPTPEEIAKIDEDSAIRQHFEKYKASLRIAHDTKRDPPNITIYQKKYKMQRSGDDFADVKCRRSCDSESDDAPSVTRTRSSLLHCGILRAVASEALHVADLSSGEAVESKFEHFLNDIVA